MRIWLSLLCVLLVAPIAQAKQRTHAKPNPTDQVLTKLGPTEIPAVQKAQPADRRQLLCLALGIYHEARSEPTDGQRAVGHVILNRVKAKGDTICQTILAHRQFAPTIQRIPSELQSWKSVQQEAVALQADPKDNTDGATMFYNQKLAHPNWARKGVETARYGDHVFMRLDKLPNTEPLPFPVEPAEPTIDEAHHQE